MIPDTPCKRTQDSTGSLHSTETFSDRQDQAREIPPPWHQDQLLLQGSHQFTDHEQGHQAAPSSPQGRQDLRGQPQRWQWVSSVLATSTPCQRMPPLGLTGKLGSRQHLAASCRRETVQLLHLELTQCDAQTGAQKGSICHISSK